MCGDTRMHVGTDLPKPGSTDQVHMRTLSEFNHQEYVIKKSVELSIPM